MLLQENTAFLQEGHCVSFIKNPDDTIFVHEYYENDDMKEYIKKVDLSKEEALKMQIAFIDFGYIKLPL